MRPGGEDVGQLYIGTCSWTDPTLIGSGRFYPPSARSAADRLHFYAANFPTVEVDSSFYALPSLRNSELWVDRTPPGFTFHIKAFGLFTNHATEVRALPKDLQRALPAELSEKRRIYPKDVPDELLQEMWRRFSEALAPLASAGKLGVVLFQFPPWFNPNEASLEHILSCQELLSDYRLAVEFRNRGWLENEKQEHTLQFLEDHRLTFVAVDAPQGFQSSLPPVAVASTDIAYIRFHGRNREAWEKPGATVSERFNYYYSEDELQEWVPPIRSLQEDARAVYAMFNTNYADQGVVNARALASLLGEGVGQPQLL